ncbi:hypothetical protein MRX96_008621 [Rhipicephalus microplus]
MEGVQFRSADKEEDAAMDVCEETGKSTQDLAQPGPSAHSSDGGGDTNAWFSHDAKANIEVIFTPGSGDASFTEPPVSPILARKQASVFDDQEFVPDELKMPAEAETIVADLGHGHGYVFQNNSHCETGAAAKKNVP